MALVKDVAISTGIFIVLVIGFLIWGFMPGSTKEILSVADQFKPDSSWKLVQDSVRAPQFICLDSVPCPSVHRTWSIPKHIENVLEFQNIATINGHSMTLLDECFYVDTDEGKIATNSCDASMNIDGYSITLSLFGSEQPAKLHLIVERDS